MPTTIRDARKARKPDTYSISAELFDAITEHIADRHSTLTDNQRFIMALWIMQTAVYEDFRYIFYLHVTALDTDAGKTEIAHILYDLCYEAMILDPTVASLSIFRKSGKHTAIIDEIQLLLTARSTDQDAFNRLVNHGTRKGVNWQVSDKDGINGVDNRDIGFPKAFLGTNPGILRQALAERCHQIVVTKGTVDDQYERARRQKIRPVIETAHKLRPQIAALASNQKLRDIIRARGTDITPIVINNELSLANRALDRWQPLIIIADLIGDEYSKRIRDIIAEQADTEPEYIATQAELIDTELRKVMRTGMLTAFNWLHGQRIAPLPKGVWLMSNSDFGWPRPSRGLKDRLPEFALFFDARTMKAQMRFRTKDFNEVCARIGWKRPDVIAAYRLAIRLDAQADKNRERSTIPLPFISGHGDETLVVIDISHWIWPVEPITFGGQTYEIKGVK
jgi:hypothetical protein